MGTEIDARALLERLTGGANYSGNGDYEEDGEYGSDGEIEWEEDGEEEDGQIDDSKLVLSFVALVLDFCCCWFGNR